MIRTSKHINKIVKIFFAFIVLIFAFVFVLANGISIRNLSFLNIQIQNLYIKLDKKLILNASEVYIKKANTNNELNINEIRKKLLRIKEYKQALLFFQNVNIKKIITTDKVFSLYYDSKNLKLSSDEGELDITINLYSKQLQAKINKLSFDNLNFYGDLKIDNSVELRGFVHSNLNDLSAKINVINNKNDFTLDIENIIIKNQEKALGHFAHLLHPTLKNWIYDRVKFENAKGSFVLYIKNNKLEKALGDAEFYNVNALYHDKVPKAFAKLVKLDLNDFDLKISANNITSEKTSVDKFELKIPNVKKPEVFIEILANKILYNNTIEKIINAYGIKLGLNQLSGFSKAKVKISLLANHTHNINVAIESNGDFNYQNTRFNTKNLSVKVDNTKVNIKADLDTSNIKAKALNIDLDAHTKQAKIYTPKLSVDFKDYFYYEKAANLNLDLAKKTLYFNELKSLIKLDKNLRINAKIKDIINYSKQLQKLKFNQGDLELLVNNNEYFLNILNAKFNFNIFTIDGTPYQTDDFHININNQKTTINTKSNLLNIIIDNVKKTINAKDLIINLDKTDERDNSNLKINLQNCKIFYDKYLLNLKNLKLNKLNDITTIKAEFNKGGELLLRDDKGLKMYIRNLSAASLNELLKKDIFLSGKIDLDANGKNLDDFEGLVNIKESYLANTKNYINLIAFIESVPSLMTLSKPGFTKKGLGIKFGSIEFSNKPDFIKINKVNILGYNVDSSGQGIYYKTNQNLDLTLNIFTLKNTNKLISNIPIIKEVFIGGKNNKIATQLTVSGNINNLEYKTSLAKDILTSPFSLIKNIITLPKNIFDR